MVRGEGRRTSGQRGERGGAVREPRNPRCPAPMGWQGACGGGAGRGLERWGLLGLEDLLGT